MLRKRALLLSLGIALGFLGCSGDESPTGPASPSAAQEGQAGGNGVDGALGDGASSSGSDSAVTVSGDGEEATARRASAGSAQADSVVPDQYIVILKPHVANRLAAADQLVGAHALTMRRNFRHALRGFAAKVPPSRLKALKRHPLVEMVVPNTVLREGGSFSGLAALGSMTAPGLMAAPEEVPGLGLRLRLVADELLGTVGDGGEVSVWPNLGSEADAAQADGTKRPTLHAGSSGLFGGHAHVGFNESTDNDEVLEVAGVVPHGSATVIAVFAQDDAYRHHYGVAGFYGNATDRVSIMTRRYRAGPDRLSYWDRTSGWKESGFVVRAGDPHIGVWRIDGSAQVDFQVDGESEGSAAMSSDIHGGWDRYLVGAPQPATAERFDGQVAELLVWDRVLSDCERDDVVSKLGARYGISVPVTGGPCIPPAAPSGLGAVASGFTGIDLSWLDGSIDEDGFSIERRLGTEGDEAFAEIAQVGPDVESYFNGGLASETEYCYRVAAFNTNGTSDYSNTACATTAPPPPPGSCVDTGGHDTDGGQFDLWHVTKVEADSNPKWQATQVPGCEPTPWLFSLDSGVDSDHPELNVVEIRNFVSAEPGHSGEDGRGHGSHTAGIAAARDGNGGTVGIAPGAPIYGFRVLNDQGAGTTEDAIAAIDEIITRKLASPDQPMVANMSLGGGANEALDVAVREAVSAGVVFTLSAGNGILGLCFLPGDAQSVSPARVGDDDITAAGGSSGDTRRANGAITVTASNQADADINCNYGNPVSVAAPGEDIASTWLNGGYATQTGTSMASPVVAGAAILYLMDHPDASPAEVEQAIIDRLEAWSTNDQPNASGRLSADGL